MSINFIYANAFCADKFRCPLAVMAEDSAFAIPYTTHSVVLTACSAKK